MPTAARNLHIKTCEAFASLKDLGDILIPVSESQLTHHCLFPSPTSSRLLIASLYIPHLKTLTSPLSFLKAFKPPLTPKKTMATITPSTMPARGHSTALKFDPTQPRELC